MIYFIKNFFLYIKSFKFLNYKQLHKQREKEPDSISDCILKSMGLNVPRNTSLPSNRSYNTDAV